MKNVFEKLREEVNFNELEEKVFMIEVLENVVSLYNDKLVDIQMGIESEENLSRDDYEEMIDFMLEIIKSLKRRNQK